MQYVQAVRELFPKTRDYFLDKGKSLAGKAGYAAATGLTAAAILASACSGGDSQLSQPEIRQAVQTWEASQQGYTPQPTIQQPSQQPSRQELRQYRPLIQTSGLNSQELSNQYPHIFQFIKDAQVSGFSGIGDYGARIFNTQPEGCLNLRESPGINAKTKTCVPENTIVYVDKGIRFVERDGYKWRYVRAEDNEGWAADEYLDGDLNLGKKPIIAFTVDIDGSKKVIVAKNNEDCANKRGTGRAWVFEEDGTVLLDTGQRGSIFKFSLNMDYFTEDNVPDLYVGSSKNFTCNSGIIGPQLQLDDTFHQHQACKNLF